MEQALATSRGRALDPGSKKRRIRLMIVDDSTVARAVLSRMVESDPAFELVAVAGSAEDAVEALFNCRVDIVILDLEMPGVGGLKSIPRIIAAGGGAKIMIVSSVAEEGAEQTIAALALGATDTMPKPGIGRFNGKFSEILLSKLKMLGHAAAGSSKLRLCFKNDTWPLSFEAGSIGTDRNSCNRGFNRWNSRAWRLLSRSSTSGSECRSLSLSTFQARSWACLRVSLE